MNILVIGNGFDLEHDLPTKYEDFLEFIKLIRQVLNVRENDDLGKIGWGKIHPQVKSMIENNMGNIPNNLFSQEKLWKSLIDNNFWIEYFLQCPMYQKENWIDFENEISTVIQSVDADMKYNNYKLDDNASVVSNFYLEQFFHDKLPTGVVDFGQGVKIITYKEIRDILYKDLNRLISALEKYICEYVERIDVQKTSDIIEGLGIDHVLSFNYTHTYQKIYDKTKNVKYDYIHGEAQNDNSIELNNMVLGIDEYLDEQCRDREVDFIAFKKFYQRIYKGTGCYYKSWLDKIKVSRHANEVSLREQFPKQIPYGKFNSKHRLYIFGHSLDITDRDILRDIILNDDIYTTIYYFNKEVMGRQIANLVRVIGQEELVRRTGGITKTIEFKPQQ